ncbi:MAG TPA: hypothetical protein PLI17_10975, partial [Denitromonas sp.]|nr:hypothetical protein [Denitromonas sp.]
MKNGTSLAGPSRSAINKKIRRILAKFGPAGNAGRMQRPKNDASGASNHSLIALSPTPACVTPVR